MARSPPTSAAGAQSAYASTTWKPHCDASPPLDGECNGDAEKVRSAGTTRPKTAKRLTSHGEDLLQSLCLPPPTLSESTTRPSFLRSRDRQLTSIDAFQGEDAQKHLVDIGGLTESMVGFGVT